MQLGQGALVVVLTTTWSGLCGHGHSKSLPWNFIVPTCISLPKFLFNRGQNIL